MEDLDPPREIPGAAADILETLAAFGMQSEEPVIYQSQRIPDYAAAFEQLRASAQIFPCRCSRQELDHSLHRGDCIASAEREPAWRVRVPEISIAFDDAALGLQSQDLHGAVGDFVIKRVEGWFAYQFAVVVDDAFQGITEVVRGADLLDSTPRQIYLQRLLGYPTPAYLHLPLVCDSGGQKLSKQDRARPVDRADPVPVLRAALEFLGFDARVFAPVGSVDRLLATAANNFDLVQLADAARHKG